MHSFASCNGCPNLDRKTRVISRLLILLGLITSFLVQSQACTQQCTPFIYQSNPVDFFQPIPVLVDFENKNEILKLKLIIPSDSDSNGSYPQGRANVVVRDASTDVKFKIQFDFLGKEVHIFSLP
eukprot:Awhi_evm1s3813